MWFIISFLFTFYFCLVKSAPDLCDICGTRSVQSRIFNGTASNYGPWTVYLEYSKDRNLYFCTGTLIDYQHVLTASHCFLGILNETPTQKAVGVEIFAGDLIKSGRKADILQASEIHIHPTFTYKMGDVNSFDDVAVIKLKKPIELSETIRPACIGDLKLNANDETLIQGYGYIDVAKNSNKLHEGVMKIRSDRDCRRVYKLMYTQQHFCAKDDQTNVAACPGDSGGGLFKLNKGRQYVVGISSWGGHCDNFPGEATVFSKVPSYLEWIRGLTNNTVDCSVKNWQKSRPRSKSNRKKSTFA